MMPSSVNDMNELLRGGGSDCPLRQPPVFRTFRSPSASCHVAVEPRRRVVLLERNVLLRWQVLPCHQQVPAAPERPHLQLVISGGNLEAHAPRDVRPREFLRGRKAPLTRLECL